MIPAAEVYRLGKLIRLLASDKDGEVVAAARALGRSLQTVGADFHDLARMVERSNYNGHDHDYQRMAQFCADRSEVLKPNERAFVQDMISWRNPSEKQIAWLTRIYERLARMAAAN
jgi:hypothetical protein